MLLFVKVSVVWQAEALWAWKLKDASRNGQMEEVAEWCRMREHDLEESRDNQKRDVTRAEASQLEEP